MEDTGITLVDSTEDTPEAEDILSQAIEALEPTYTLGYVHYSDYLDDERVAKLLEPNGWETVEDDLREAFDEMRWDATMDVAERVVDSLGIDDAWDILRSDLASFDELRLAIEERDDFDPLDELLTRTGRVLFRYDLEHEVSGGTWDWDDDQEDSEARAIADAAGIDYDANRATILAMLANVGNGGRLSVIFECPAEDVVRPALEMDWGQREGEARTLTFEDAHLSVLNPYEGSGWVSDPVGTVTKRFHPQLLTVDSTSHYGWTEVAGPVGGAYETTTVVK